MSLRLEGDLVGIAVERAFELNRGLPFWLGLPGERRILTDREGDGVLPFGGLPGADEISLRTGWLGLRRGLSLRCGLGRWLIRTRRGSRLGSFRRCSHLLRLHFRRWLERFKQSLGDDVARLLRHHHLERFSRQIGMTADEVVVGQDKMPGGAAGIGAAEVFELPQLASVGVDGAIEAAHRRPVHPRSDGQHCIERRRRFRIAPESKQRKRPHLMEHRVVGRRLHCRIDARE